MLLIQIFQRWQLVVCGTTLKLWFEQIDYIKLCLDQWAVPVQKPEIWPWTWSFFPDSTPSARGLLFLKNQPRTKLAARGLFTSARDRWWPAHCAVVIVLVCVGLGGSARQKYIGEVLRPELKDTTGVSLTYQQKQQTSDSAHSDDTPNPTPPVTFSSHRQRVLSF